MHIWIHHCKPENGCEMNDYYPCLKLFCEHIYLDHNFRFYTNFYYEGMYWVSVPMFCVELNYCWLVFTKGEKKDGNRDFVRCKLGAR